MAVDATFSRQTERVGGSGQAIADRNSSRRPLIPGWVAWLLLGCIVAALALMAWNPHREIKGYVFLSAGLVSAIFVILKNLAANKMESIAAFPGEIPFVVTFRALAFSAFALTGAHMAISDQFTQRSAFSCYFAGLAAFVMAQFAWKGSRCALVHPRRTGNPGMRAETPAIKAWLTKRIGNRDFVP